MQQNMHLDKTSINMQNPEYKALDYEHGVLTSRYQTHVSCNCPNNSVFSICFDTAQDSLREARVV